MVEIKGISNALPFPTQTSMITHLLTELLYILKIIEQFPVVFGIQTLPT